jgi:hypothetical protein
MHGRQELETEEEPHRRKPLSALVITHEERRRRKVPPLLGKYVSLRVLTAAQEQGELYVRDREEMFQLYNIYSQHNLYRSTSSIAMRYV